MRFVPTAITNVLIIDPKMFGDTRGFFFESYNRRQFVDLIGRDIDFVHDNLSRSAKNVLRGLHYHIQQPLGKLVRVVQVEELDVAVDTRKSSPTFGRWIGKILSADNKQQLWVSEGFTHGFVVLSEIAEFLYKATAHYAPKYERCIRWNDATLNINWPINVALTLSAKDKEAQELATAEVFA